MYKNVLNSVSSGSAQSPPYTAPWQFNWKERKPASLWVNQSCTCPPKTYNYLYAISAYSTYKYGVHTLPSPPQYFLAPCFEVGRVYRLLLRRALFLPVYNFMFTHKILFKGIHLASYSNSSELWQQILNRDWRYNVDGSSICFHQIVCTCCAFQSCSTPNVIICCGIDWKLSRASLFQYVVESIGDSIKVSKTVAITFLKM